jgi:hypothetical protein
MLCTVTKEITMETCDRCGATVEWIAQKRLTLKWLLCVLFCGVCRACDSKVIAVARAHGKALVRINTGLSAEVSRFAVE